MLNRHEHVLELVDDYLHDALLPEDAAVLEEHCDACRICQVALDEARQRLQAVRSIPPLEASDALIRKTLQRVNATVAKERAHKRSVYVAGGLAAAAAIVIGAFHLYYSKLHPDPVDLQVYGQSELLADTQAALRVRLVNRARGAALRGVPVDIDMRAKTGQPAIRLASFTTDAQGTGQPIFRLPDWKDGDYELRVTARPGGEPEMISRTIKLKRSWKVMLSTDKPVYQPGQTIRMRGLTLRRPDLKPVAGQDAAFSITDPKGNVIFKQRDVTSRFGIVSADCPLAAEIIEGAYTVACQVGDTTSRSAVDVRSYVLPKFKVAIELDQFYYQPGQALRGSVRADYFFGRPVSEAEVEVELQTGDGPAASTYTRSMRTGADGRVTFDFMLPETLIGREQESGDVQIALQVTVTDTAGQKQAARASRVVALHPVHIEAIPESGALVRGTSNTLYVLTTYADGRPARSRIAASGIAEEIVTNSLGVAALQVTPSGDEVKLILRATDDEGRSGRREISLRCGQWSDDFLIRTDKAVYQGGETVHFAAFGRGREPVFLDFIKDGQTLLTETIPMSAGSGDFQFDLPPDVFGTIDLCAYRFSDSGFPVRKTRVIYVRPPQRLNVTATMDSAEYRPGTKARLTLALSDDKGSAVAGAVSLAAVDEAVFAVVDSPSGLERTFFNLDQEVLKPIYAIYPWSPDSQIGAPPAEQAQFEQALFARAGRSRGKRDIVLQRLLDEGDISPKQLEVFSDPEFERTLQRAALPEHIVNLLRQDSLHTLSSSTYPEKLRRAALTQSERLGYVRDAWIVLAIVAGGALVLTLCALVRGVWVFICLVLGGLCLVAMLMPSLSRARELSKSLVSLANLKGIGTGLMLYENEHGPLEFAETTDAGAVRVRDWFPETLLWRPELITDDNGRATVDIDLADSVTTWRLTASAVTADGRLAGAQSSIRVFQPFFVDLNLPVALTRGDEVSIPVVVYSYLDHAQTIEVTLDDCGGLDRLDEATRQIELASGDVRSVNYRVRARQIGVHTLQVKARSGGVADALRRTIEVKPDGRRIEEVVNGVLNGTVEIPLSAPADAIEGSVTGTIKLYPSSFSQLVEGLDAIFQQPYGCFEQTSSTTYPNVLALDYLHKTNQSRPEIEAKARQYIHLGYQRLLGFEVPEGGFDWFGHPPANRTLTAYGLMEFEDMARVHEIDQNLIERTRKWLLAQRSADGSWAPETHVMHTDPTRRGASDAALSTTAYIAWAVFGGSSVDADARATMNYLLRHEAASISDPYVLALVCNALLSLDTQGHRADAYLDRLNALKRTSDDRKLIWWEQGAGSYTTFYGAGRGGSIETTALASLAMMKSGRYAGMSHGALAWLVQQKDARGTWYSTQATVLALKALLAGTNAALADQREHRIEILANGAAPADGRTAREVRIASDQSDVTKQVDVSEYFTSGGARLTLTDRSGGSLAYQAVLSYYVPVASTRPAEALTIDLSYDRADLRVGDTITATARIVNNLPQSAPMVILDLPIPPGFMIEGDDLRGLVSAGTIAKYQTNTRSIIVYLRELAASTPLVLHYRLRATMPVRITTPAPRAYHYYDSDRQGVGRTAELVVS